jgi:signal transduction histidine kinase
LRAAKSGKLSAMPKEQLIEKLERAEAQLQRVSGAIEQLLGARKAEEEGIVLSPTEVDLSEVVRDAISRLAIDGSRPTLDLSANRPIVGRWDRELLHRAVGNLLTFSLGPAAAPDRIEVVVKRGGRGARCSIRDNGLGLSASEQSSLLAGPGRDPDRLGVWIARRIVEAHGGRLAVRSAPGTGTTFLVDLPLEGA